MKKAIMKQWVKALRSGKFKQTTNVLYDGKGYCCLGVLCRLHANEHHKTFRNKIASNHEKYYLDQCSLPPNQVVKWAGLNGSNPVVEGNSLGYSNDTLSKNFNTIANLIEKNYKTI